MTKFKKSGILILGLLLMIFVTIGAPAASANTEDHLLQVTEEPEKLELQLGTDWAGTEFELTTDEGTFPVPVVVGEDGFLRMELGGSKVYALRILQLCDVAANSNAQTDTSQAASPDLQDVSESDVPDDTGELSSAGMKGGQASEPTVDSEAFSIPPLHIILFCGGMAICIAVLILMHIMKKRRSSYEEDDGYYDDEEEDE